MYKRTVGTVYDWQRTRSHQESVDFVSKFGFKNKICVRKATLVCLHTGSDSNKTIKAVA